MSGQDYQDYLQQKHSKFNTPDGIINQVVSEATGSLPLTKKRIIVGEVNEVYDISTKDKQEVIVRISRSKHPRFHAEKRAIEMARKAEVPAPEVLLVKKMQTNLTFSIEKKIDGTPLCDLRPTLRSENMKKIINESGSILSKIHSVFVDSFGEFDRKKSIWHGSYKEKIPRGFKEILESTFYGKKDLAMLKNLII